MAFFHVNFYSKVLKINTDLQVFIPSPNPMEKVQEGNEYFNTGIKYKVLYLLHGTYGDYTDWIRLTNVERYAKEKNIALVMTSAGNAFYKNMDKGFQYFTFFTEELPAFVTTYFPISNKREDNFIAGLSMGGFGAVNLALHKPEKYGACASLSGVLDVKEFHDHIDNYMEENPYVWDAIYKSGELDEKNEILETLDQCIEKGLEIPRIYQSVGMEDTTAYAINKKISIELKKRNIKYIYEEEQGIHDWDFWDKQIKKVMEWI